MFYVYIMTNQRKNVLYIGVTRDLVGRVLQHKRKEIAGFTSRYNVNSLAYFEEYQYVYDAIVREKQLKGWRRAKKEWLIKRMNPLWKDVSIDWC